MPDPRDTERLRATIEAVHAPPELHARIAAQVHDAAAPRPRRAPLRLALGGAVAAVATAVVLALVVPGGGTGTPTVAQAARLGTAPATQPAPAVDRRYSRWLDAQVGGVAFPSWRDIPGWRATGARRDRLGGRDTMTVYYAGPGAQRIAYTIVDGSPLPWPQPSRAVRRGGTELRVARDARGRTLVTWRERGHQCVIAASARVSAARLVALAAWSSAQARPA